MLLMLRHPLHQLRLGSESESANFKWGGAEPERDNENPMDGLRQSDGMEPDPPAETRRRSDRFPRSEQDGGQVMTVRCTM